MNQDLKYRIIGAVVITCLAAIFVPMLFDDPIDETGKRISELTIPSAPVKSVEKELALIPKNTEAVINLPVLAEIKEDEEPLQAAFENNVKWFIQVGIFGQESNAVLLQNKIRQQGYPVTISTVATEKGELYRVRVGPELDKERVQAMKEKIDEDNKLKGIITSVDE